MQYMNEKLGSWQVSGDEKAGKAQFKVFFPKESTGLQHHIKSIYVCGSFQKALGQANDWEPNLANQMTRSQHTEGEIWVWLSPKELPHDFYQYKYYVTFNDSTTRWVSDPCARYGGENNMNAAFVIGGSQPGDNVISTLKDGRKSLKELVIYELMIDDFTSEFRAARAPLDAVCDKLDYLMNCGFNAILFMPWTAWNDDKFNWGYTPSQGNRA